VELGSGDQLLFGGPGNDTLGGGIGSGRDALWGDDGDDQLYGGDDGDFLDGGAGADRLFGEEGADTLVGGFGSDLLDGTDEGDFAEFDPDLPQHDLVSYAAFDEPVIVDLSAAIATHPAPTGGDTETDQLADVTDILGGSSGDVLTGNFARNGLWGGAGDDTLHGMDGKDTLVAGDGTDVLDGGDNHDWLFGLSANGTVGQNVFRGGGGTDWAISAEDDERAETERWFTSVDDFVAALD
jgi:Ca2+-binding RTX toxin-like protein